MKYAWDTIRHKWFVLLACIKLKVSLWRALTHDLSKFGRAELRYYNRHFFGDKSNLEGFAKAWLHHYHRNDHHWEHWIVESVHGFSDPTRDNCIVNNCLPMPIVCVREMVADWMGASMRHTGSWDMTDWLKANLSKMKLHPKTFRRVEALLWVLGYKGMIHLREKIS